MQADFSLTLHRQEQTTSLVCSGELDISTCDRLQEGVELCLESNPSLIKFDGRGISLLTSTGIEILYRLAETCAKSDISLEMALSPAARRILDLVGLWWLGMPGEEFLGDGLDRALLQYAEVRDRDLSIKDSYLDGASA